MFDDKSPIVASATAPGRSGVGIVRLSGPKDKVEAIVRRYFKGQEPLKPRYAHLRAFHDERGERLDEGLALFFPAPRSYTGETVLELQAHGGPVVLSMLTKALLIVGRSEGLRMAEPGEFTRRAFLNGKIDLSQAESIADMIDAGSENAVRAANRSLAGEFSLKIHGLMDSLAELRAHLEAILDFPEEEVDFLSQSHAGERLEAIRETFEGVFRASRKGSVLREGVCVVLVGSPNVGKSSLMNALSGQEVAIVTEVAGTTRDRIENLVHIEGVPFRLVDTAGLHETQDLVEKIGIARTLEAASDADILVHISDATHEVSDDEGNRILSDLKRRLGRRVPVVEVLNKADLAQVADAKDRIAVSAVTGQGVCDLEKRLLELAGWEQTTEDVFLARQRHLESLERARRHIGAAQEALASPVPMLDIVAEELRLAGASLGEIVGETATEDLLGMIFSRFCIGK